VRLSDALGDQKDQEGRMKANGNTTHACVDCGRYALITHPIVHHIGKRIVNETVCGRCYLRRQAGE